MKIRMKQDSLRLRLGRAELERFLKDGRIQETTRFAASPEAGFTYALEVSSPGSAGTTLRTMPCGVTVVVTPEQVRLWKRDDQVGIYTDLEVDTDTRLEVIVEKDFACLDRSDSDNADTFANPNLSANCQAG